VVIGVYGVSGIFSFHQRKDNNFYPQNTFEDGKLLLLRLIEIEGFKTS
jgi:hypothetical protein